MFFKVYHNQKIQMSDVRGQKTDVRGQKTDVRDQMTEGRRQRAEDRCQRSEDRKQRSDYRGQNSEVGRRPPAHRGLRLRPGGNGEVGKNKFENRFH
jgi:hypothetical protein